MDSYITNERYGFEFVEFRRFETVISGTLPSPNLELVSKVVFWSFFEVSLLITLEPHVGHTKVTDFSTLS